MTIKTTKVTARKWLVLSHDKGHFKVEAKEIKAILTDVNTRNITLTHNHGNKTTLSFPNIMEYLWAISQLNKTVK